MSTCCASGFGHCFQGARKIRSALCRCFTCRGRALVEPVTCRNAYEVLGAGCAAVNGVYSKLAENKDGAPCYANPAGFLLFRFRMRNGNCFWYISHADADLGSANGDFYRVKSNSCAPPFRGWIIEQCPGGVLPAPNVRARDEDGDAHETAPTKDELTVQLEVITFTGEELGCVAVGPSWTGAEVKQAISQLLPVGRGATRVIVGTDVFRDAQTVSELGLAGGGTVFVVAAGAAVIVSNAGSSSVNGNYYQQDELMNEAPCYRNEVGTLLFKYIMKSGAHFWYFSVDGNLNKAAGDYYRCKSTALLPPDEGWTSSACPLAKLPVPELQVLSQD